MSQPVSRVFSEAFYNSLRLPGAHIAVAENGTVLCQKEHPITFKDRVNRFFNFTQDPDLLAVNARLSALMDQVKNKQGDLYDKLKAEAHNHRYWALHTLHTNLGPLNRAFKKSNSKSYLTLLILGVINLARSLFGYQCIKFKTHQILDLSLLTRENFPEVFELTEADRKKIQYTLHVANGENNGAAPNRPALSQENISKLECDLLYEIFINSNEHRFSLSYDPKGDRFTLMHRGLINTPNCSKQLADKTPFEVECSIHVYKYSLVVQDDCTATKFTQIVKSKEGSFPWSKWTVSYSRDASFPISITLEPGYMYQLGDDQNTAVSFQLTKN